jgi:hypothetical protein
MPRIDTARQNYQDYKAKITDAIGCINIDLGTRVCVNPNGIKDLSQDKVLFTNPVSHSGTMNVTPDLLGSNLQIYSSKGELQYETKVESQSIPIGTILSTTGIYFYTLTTLKGNILSGRLMKANK